MSRSSYSQIYKNYMHPVVSLIGQSRILLIFKLLPRSNLVTVICCFIELWSILKRTSPEKICGPNQLYENVH